MEIKDFLEKLAADDADLLLLQDNTDGLFKHIKKANLLAGLNSGGGGGGGGAGLSPWQVRSANYTAQNGDRIVADTTNSWTLTLPQSVNAEIELIRVGSANNPLNIQGLTKFEGREVLSLRMSPLYRKVHLFYVNDAIGWIANPANVITPIYPFTPTSLSGLLVWYKSSEGITKDSNNLVSQWNDLSSNNNHLKQVTASKHPLYVPDVYSGKPAIRFSDGSKHLDFTRLTNIRSIYWLIRFQKSNDTDAQFILGDSSNYPFSAVNTNNYTDTQYSDNFVRNGIFRVNGIASAISSTARSTNLVSLSSITTGNITANSFAADRGNQYGSRSWQGDLVELAICSTAHTETEIINMETYLKSEYNHY